MVDSDPLRFVGFRSLLSSESDFDLQPVSLAEVATHQDIDVVLLGSHTGKNVIDMLGTVKAVRPSLNIIVTGCKSRRRGNAAGESRLARKAVSMKRSRSGKSCAPSGSCILDLFRPRDGS